MRLRKRKGRRSSIVHQQFYSFIQSFKNHRKIMIKIHLIQSIYPQWPSCFLIINDLIQMNMYNICQMEKKLTYLSLGNWPQSPTSLHHLQLTPITKRILTQVHLKPQQILPLTLIQFRKNTEKMDNRNEFNQSNLQFQNQRRMKQVSILTSIRNKYILGKDYNSPLKKNSPKPRSLIKSRQSSSNKSNISNIQQFSNLKLAQVLSRTKSQSKIQLNSVKTRQLAKPIKKQDSDYFIHFNPHKQSPDKVRPKQYIQQQSTKSKGTQPQKSHLTQERHSEYGNFFLNKNTKLRMKKDQSITRSHQEQSKELCHELLTTMERWEELDREHMKEMRKMKDLNQHQKDRLAKMQEVQKTQMRNRIKKIKSRLNSQNTQI